MVNPAAAIRVRTGFLGHLKQQCRAWMPASAWSLLKALGSPVEAFCLRRRQAWLIRTSLPQSLRKEFKCLFRQAEMGWNSGRAEPAREMISLPVGNSGRHLAARRGTSDVLVYYQVFVEEQYAKCQPALTRTIVDCGANVGYASVYFLQKFPEAKLVALEPDPLNYKLCQENLRPFQGRAKVLPIALSGQSGEVKLDPAAIGTWVSRIASSNPAEDRMAPAERGGAQPPHRVRSVDVPSLMKQEALETIDLLKIDIEGAEFNVFQAGDLSWLDLVDTIAIELHGQACRTAFFTAMAGRNFTFEHYGEIVTGRRREVPV